jgi:hypothetical protein
MYFAIRKVVPIEWRSTRRLFFGEVAELAEHQVVSLRGARSALLLEGDAFLGCSPKSCIELLISS